jgi:hypothetical protein
VKALIWESTKFLAEEIHSLGHTIGKKGMMAMLKDILAIKNYKKPASKSGCLAF